MNVYDHAHSLARALRQHPDVVAMQAAKEKIDADPKTKEMFDNFVQKNMALQMQELGGNPPDEAEKEELEKLAEVVFLHADIRNFHELSIRVERLMQDIYGIIAKGIGSLTEEA